MNRHEFAAKLKAVKAEQARISQELKDEIEGGVLVDAEQLAQLEVPTCWTDLGTLNVSMNGLGDLETANQMHEMKEIPIR